MAIRYLDEEEKPKSRIRFTDSDETPAATGKNKNWLDALFPRSSKAPLDPGSAPSVQNKVAAAGLDILSLLGRLISSAPALAPGGESFKDALSRTRAREDLGNGFNDLPSRTAAAGAGFVGDALRDPATALMVPSGLAVERAALKLAPELSKLKLGAIQGTAEGGASALTHAIDAGTRGDKYGGLQAGLEVLSGPLTRAAGGITKAAGKGVQTIGEGVQELNPLGREVLGRSGEAAPITNRFGFEFTPSVVAGEKDGVRKAIELTAQENAILRDIPEAIKDKNREAAIQSVMGQRKKFAGAPATLAGTGDMNEAGSKFKTAFEKAKGDIGKRFETQEEESLAWIARDELPKNVGAAPEDLAAATPLKAAPKKDIEAAVNDIYQRDMEEFKRKSAIMESVLRANPKTVLRDHPELIEHLPLSKRPAAVRKIFGVGPDERMGTDFDIPKRMGIDQIAVEKGRDADMDVFLDEGIEHYNYGAKPSKTEIRKKVLDAEQGDIFGTPKTEAEMGIILDDFNPIPNNEPLMAAAGKNIIQDDISNFLKTSGYSGKITGNESIGENAIKYLDQLQSRVGNAKTVEDLLNQRRNFADKIKAQVWDNGAVFTSRDAAALEQNYGQLNRRIGEAFEREYPGDEGKSLRKLWEANNAEYSKNRDLLEGIEKGLGLGRMDEGTYFKRVQNIGIENLKKLSKEAYENPDLAPVWANIQAGFFDNFLRDSIDRGITNDIALSPSRLSNNWRNIDKAVKETILGKDVVADMDEIISSIKKVSAGSSEFFNPSGTARASNLRESLNPKNAALGLLLKDKVRQYYKTGNVSPVESVLSMLTSAGKKVQAAGKGVENFGFTFPYIAQGQRSDYAPKEINPDIANLKRP